MTDSGSMQLGHRRVPCTLKAKEFIQVSVCLKWQTEMSKASNGNLDINCLKDSFKMSLGLLKKQPDVGRISMLNTAEERRL